MTEQNQDLAIAEAQLMIAACAYVDATVDGEPLETRRTHWDTLRRAVGAYRTALQAQPTDHALVEQGMRVVRRLMEQR